MAKAERERGASLKILRVKFHGIAPSRRAAGFPRALRANEAHGRDFWMLVRVGRISECCRTGAIAAALALIRNDIRVIGNNFHAERQRIRLLLYV
jgi:hypothetical protein